MDTQFTTLHKLASGQMEERWFSRMMEAGKKADLVLAAMGDRGYNQASDIITETIDGIQVNDLWDEFIATLNTWNEDRDVLMALLSYNVTQLTERVFVPTSEEDFEEATEYGEPKGIRLPGKPTIMGYSFKWYDLAVRYTWLFLAESSADQVRALNNAALEADNRLVFNQVFRRLFNPTNDTALINDMNVNVYPLYNADGTVPPRWRTNTFNGTHTHFLTSGAATVDSGDLDAMATHLEHHGFDVTHGYRFVLLVNDQEASVIQTFTRAGGSKWDFIPGPNLGGGIILPSGQVIEGRPVQDVGPIDERIGTYGPWQIVKDWGIPAGYMVGFATGGELNLGNPIGIREHSNGSLRGLRLVKGPDRDYPLVDSFYQHGLGTGVRQRGGGVITQITASATYAPPAAYA
jgi:hypothetical protein